MITPTPISPGDDDEFSQMAEIPDSFASLVPETDPEPVESLPVPVELPNQKVAPSPAPEGQTGLEVYLSKVPPDTREAVLKRARRQGFSDTDPIWEIVLAVRERDDDFRADLLKSPEILKEVIAELRPVIEDLKSTAKAESEVAKKLDQSNAKTNAFLVKESDWQGKVLIGVALALILNIGVAVWGNWETRATRNSANAITEALITTNFDGLVEQLKRANRQMELVRGIQIVTNRRQELLFQENTIDREIISLQRARSEGRLTADEQLRANTITQRQQELADAWSHLGKLEDELRAKIDAAREN